jgi:acyl dehydratase
MTEIPPRHIGPITRTDIVKFAGAGGDFNPVHHDHEFARQAGYPSVFAMGMFTAGMLGDYLSDALGFDRVRSFSVRFDSPTWPGDELDFRAGADPAGGAKLPLVVSHGEETRLSGEAGLGTAADEARPVPETPDDLAYLRDHPTAEVILPVERGKVMEFARAVKSKNPLHFDRDAAEAAGFDDIVAPLTFSTVSAHYNGGDAADLPRELGLDLARMVHGEQRWVFHRPLVAGDSLHGLRQVVAAWRKASRSGGEMTFVAVAIDYRDEADEPVLREETLMIELPKRP